MTKTICTSLSLQSVFLYQLQPHSQRKYTIVVRKNVLWQILCMDKCVCVVHLFYTRVHVWFDPTRVFLPLHLCMPFKLWVICTVIIKINI